MNILYWCSRFRERREKSSLSISMMICLAVNREIVGEILKQTGASVETAEDGEICCSKVETMPAGYYDLILMDIMMPNMDGLEAARRIRQLSDKGKAMIPIVAMTTNVSAVDRRNAKAAGMDGFTEKPILVESLFAVLRSFLQERRQES